MKNMIVTWFDLIRFDCPWLWCGDKHDGDADADDVVDVDEGEDDDGTSPKTPIDNTSLIVNDCAIFPSMIRWRVQP